MARGDAVLVLGADDSALQAGLGASRRRVQSWGTTVAADINKSFKSGLNSLANMTGFAGVGLFAQQAREVIMFEDALNQLGVSARLNQYQQAALGEKIREAGIETGISAEEILGGVSAYVALTGDVTTASASLGIFSRAAQATSTPIEEIAKTAAALSMNLGVTSVEMEQALSGIASQGKAGAVEFKEMAGIVSNLAPRFAQFNTVGTKGLAEMNGLLQVMRVGFGTTGEAATSLEAIMGALTDSGTVKKLAGIGVKAFTTDSKGVRHMRDLRDIIIDVLKQTKGDPMTISKIFGRKEAVAGITKLSDAFEKNADSIDDMIAAAGRSGEMQEDLAKRMNSPKVALDQLRERLKATFSVAIAKNLDDIVGGLTKLAGVLEWMVENKGAVIAMFAAIKAGGYIGGLGAGGSAAGAGFGAYGGGGGVAMAGRAFGIGGGLLQGAALGFGAHQIAGATGMGTGFDKIGGVAGAMGSFTDEIFTGAAAISALPGPLGMLGKAVSIGTGTITAFFESLNAQVDALNKRILEGQYGDFGTGMADEFRASSGGAERRAGLSAGLAGMVDTVFGGPSDGGQAGRFLLRSAKKSGALKVTGADKGKPTFELDEKVLEQDLADEALTDAEKRHIINQTIAAVKVANETGSLNADARSLFGVARAPQLVSVEIGFEDGTPVAKVVKNDRRRRREGK